MKRTIQKIVAVMTVGIFAVTNCAYAQADAVYPMNKEIGSHIQETESTLDTHKNSGVIIDMMKPAIKEVKESTLRFNDAQSFLWQFEKDERFEEYSYLFKQPVGDKQGYTVRERIALVLTMYENYLMDTPLPEGVTPEFFATCLALKEMGRGMATEFNPVRRKLRKKILSRSERRISEDNADAAQLMRDFLPQFGFGEHVGLGLSLLGMIDEKAQNFKEPFFLMASYEDRNEVLGYLNTMSENSGIDADAFFDIYKGFVKCYGASYSRQAIVHAKEDLRDPAHAEYVTIKGQDIKHDFYVVDPLKQRISVHPRDAARIDFLETMIKTDDLTKGKTAQNLNYLRNALGLNDDAVNRMNDFFAMLIVKRDDARIDHEANNARILFEEIVQLLQEQLVVADQENNDEKKQRVHAQVNMFQAICAFGASYGVEHAISFLAFEEQLLLRIDLPLETYNRIERDVTSLLKKYHDIITMSGTVSGAVKFINDVMLSALTGESVDKLDELFLPPAVEETSKHKELAEVFPRDIINLIQENNVEMAIKKLEEHELFSGNPQIYAFAIDSYLNEGDYAELLDKYGISTIQLQKFINDDVISVMEAGSAPEKEKVNRFVMTVIMKNFEQEMHSMLKAVDYFADATDIAIEYLGSGRQSQAFKVVFKKDGAELAKVVKIPSFDQNDKAWERNLALYQRAYDKKEFLDDCFITCDAVSDISIPQYIYEHYNDEGERIAREDKVIVQDYVTDMKSITYMLKQVKADQKASFKLIDEYIKLLLRLHKQGFYLADAMQDNVISVNGELRVADIGGTKESLSKSYVEYINIYFGLYNAEDMFEKYKKSDPHNLYARLCRLDVRSTIESKLAKDEKPSYVKNFEGWRENQAGYVEELYNTMKGPTQRETKEQIIKYIAAEADFFIKDEKDETELQRLLEIFFTHERQFIDLERTLEELGLRNNDVYPHNYQASIKAVDMLEKSNREDVEISDKFRKMMRVCADIARNGDAYSMNEYIERNAVDRTDLDAMLNESTALRKQINEGDIKDEVLVELVNYVFDTLHGYLMPKVEQVIRSLGEYKDKKGLSVAYLASGGESTVFRLSYINEENENEYVNKAIKVPSLGGRGGRLGWSNMLEKHKTISDNRTLKDSVVEAQVYRNDAFGDLYKNLFGIEYSNGIVVQSFLKENSYDGWFPYLDTLYKEQGVDAAVEFVKQCFDALGRLFDQGYIFEDLESDTFIIDHSDGRIKVMDIGSLKNSASVRLLRLYAVTFFDKITKDSAGNERSYFRNASEEQKNEIKEAKEKLQNRVDALSQDPQAYSERMFNEVIDKINLIEFKDNESYKDHFEEITKLIASDSMHMYGALELVVSNMQAAVDADVEKKLRRTLATNLKAYKYERIVENDVDGELVEETEAREVENVIQTRLQGMLDRHQGKIQAMFKSVSDNNVIIEMLFNPEIDGFRDYKKILDPDTKVDIKHVFVLVILAHMALNDVDLEVETPLDDVVGSDERKALLNESKAPNFDIMHYKSA
ncbi:MAG: hypothetical protein JW938_01855 [Candidatus Omnitrophica bacterium]|nr:hypothetical protein [Candidatus Omnitrophota bacterium]